jgi:hypothetical protein
VSIVLGLLVTFMGGVSGYICRLSDDRARHDRFQRVVSLSAVVAIGVILFAFPDLWRWLHRAGGFVFVVCFLGGISSVSMFLVGTGWGLIHLVGYLSSVRRPDMKKSTTASFDEVWDRELDRNLPAGKL